MSETKPLWLSWSHYRHYLITMIHIDILHVYFESSFQVVFNKYTSTTDKYVHSQSELFSEFISNFAVPDEFNLIPLLPAC